MRRSGWTRAGAETHAGVRFPGWRLKTDFDGRVVNDAATSETSDFRSRRHGCFSKASRRVRIWALRSECRVRLTHAQEKTTATDTARMLCEICRFGFPGCHGVHHFSPRHATLRAERPGSGYLAGLEKHRAVERKSGSSEVGHHSYPDEIRVECHRESHAGGAFSRPAVVHPERSLRFLCPAASRIKSAISFG